jgi:hypothetical protein
MKTILAAALIAAGIAAVPTMANAQERVGDGAMGAAAGAVAFGPVGALAGGLTGFFAGPHISRDLGFHHHYYRHRHYSYRETRDYR